MPVLVEYATHNSGWKADQNGRFGMVAVITFKNKETGARLFEFAPTLGDCDNMSYFAALVKALDEHNKALLMIQAEISKINDAAVIPSCGGCK
jgi:hypothetical protein